MKKSSSRGPSFSLDGGGSLDSEISLLGLLEKRAVDLEGGWELFFSLSLTIFFYLWRWLFFMVGIVDATKL